MARNSKTVSADVLCEFFEVAVHSILYNRKIYPESIFQPKRKYGATVYQSLHPEINEYISESLKAVNYHAKKGRLQKLFVCFHTDDVLHEKYIIDVLDLKDFLEADPFLVDMEQAFRAFCLKIHTSNYYLQPLPDGANFSIRILTTTYSSLEFNQEPSFENFPWIEISDKEFCVESGCIVPIYTIDKDFLKLQIYIEKPANPDY